MRLRESLTLMFFAAVLASAAAAQAPSPDGGNIGFVADPPAALRERFPMCDAFLNVEWIDKEKRVGYAHYEAIVKNKKNQFKGERRLVWGLVSMTGWHRIDYDVYQYKNKGRLEELFRAVREGEVKTAFAMMIRHEGRRIDLYGGKAVNDDANHPLLSDHRKTVCVPYPDNERVWVIEGKTVGQMYGKAQIDGLSATLTKMNPRGIARGRVEKLWLIDINRDGRLDFLFEDTFAYTQGDRLYQMERENDRLHFNYRFPPGGGVCRVRIPPDGLLTTDGKDYYRYGCNLTELTSPR